jgi:predicted negative regulator of RcsB-dependent stress response
MSTELYDAKNLADDIHDIAKVPPALNEHIYGMTLAMIEALIRAMDDANMSMAEQRIRMGKKKDELISELISLRDRRIVFSPDGVMPAANRTVSMRSIQVRR